MYRVLAKRSSCAYNKKKYIKTNSERESPSPPPAPPSNRTGIVTTAEYNNT